MIRRHCKHPVWSLLFNYALPFIQSEVTNIPNVCVGGWCVGIVYSVYSVRVNTLLLTYAYVGMCHVYMLLVVYNYMMGSLHAYLHSAHTAYSYGMEAALHMP